MKTIGDILKGFFSYDMVVGIYARKRCLDHLFMLVLFGRTIGFPGLFNYYHLRLIPYYLRHMEYWKRRVLKERDFFDLVKD